MRKPSSLSPWFTVEQLDEWRKLTPRPHHAKQDAATMEAFKKTTENARKHSPEPSCSHSNARDRPFISSGVGKESNLTIQ
jgi:hypothetical protein